MKKDSKKSNGSYSTMDAYQSGYLTLKGFPVQLIPQGNKVVFFFEASPELYKAIEDYNAGATVEAVRLALATKALKTRIHSIRKDNGNHETRFMPT
jgi:hypothetical protein